MSFILGWEKQTQWVFLSSAVLILKVMVVENVGAVESDIPLPIPIRDFSEPLTLPKKEKVEGVANKTAIFFGPVFSYYEFEV